MMKERVRRISVALAGVVAFSACETNSGPRGGAVMSVRVEPQTIEVAVNETASLEVRLLNAAGQEVAAAERIHWTSENEVVAGVSATGLITGRLAGTTRVAASYRGISGIANVTVRSGPVASVTLSPSPLEINVGATAQLLAIARDVGGSTVAGRSANWASQDASIASVTATGLVSGGKPGQTTITATVDGITGAASVIVSERPVASVQVNPANPSLLVGETQRMTATARAESGEIVGGAVTWASSDRTIAEVSADGLVKANTTGTATITATVGGVDGSTIVTVSGITAARIGIPAGSADPDVQRATPFVAGSAVTEGDVSGR